MINKIRENKLFTVVVILIGLFLFASITYYAVFSDSWFDETNYGYKSWLVAEGLAQPFVDFGTKYPPVALYSQTFIQDVFGPSTFSARILSGFFLLGVIFLIFDMLRRRGGKWLGLLGVSLITFHTYTIVKYIAAIPNAMIVFLGLLSIWFLHIKRLKVWQSIALSSVAMSMAVLVRYNLLPALVVLWFFVLFKYRSPKYFILSLLVSFATIGVLIVPYLILDAEHALSYFLAMFGPLTALFPLDFFSLGSGVADNSSGSILNFFFNEGRLKIVMQVLTTYFHIWAILFSGLLMAVYKWRGNIKVFFDKNSFLVLNFMFVILLFLAHFFFGPNRHKINVLYFVPFMVLSASYILHIVYSKFVDAGVWDKVRGVIVPLIVAVIILASFSIAISGNDTIFFNRFDYSDTDLNRVNRGASYLESVTTFDDVILTIDNPDHVFIAGRYMIPERINRHDSYTDSDDEVLLKRFAHYNTNMFLVWLKEDTDVFVVQRGTFNERLEPISGGTDLVTDVENILSTQYNFAGSIEGVYPRKDNRSGIMDIYRKKDDK